MRTWNVKIAWRPGGGHLIQSSSVVTAKTAEEAIDNVLDDCAVPREKVIRLSAHDVAEDREK